MLFLIPFQPLFFIPFLPHFLYHPTPIFMLFLPLFSYCLPHFHTISTEILPHFSCCSYPIFHTNSAPIFHTISTPILGHTIPTQLSAPAQIFSPKKGPFLTLPLFLPAISRDCQTLSPILESWLLSKLKYCSPVSHGHQRGSRSRSTLQSLTLQQTILLIITNDGSVVAKYKQ